MKKKKEKEKEKKKAKQDGRIQNPQLEMRCHSFFVAFC